MYINREVSGYEVLLRISGWCLELKDEDGDYVYSSYETAVEKGVRGYERLVVGATDLGNVKEELRKTGRVDIPDDKGYYIEIRKVK